MFNVFLVVSLLPIIVISYRLGHYAGFNDADQFKPVDEMDTPIYNQMALEHPETFMFMKAKQL